MSDFVVTLSTCCRNRAEHVKETFLKNLEDNQQEYVRFLLVNYNSQDDLDEWAREHLAQYIPSGRVLYVHEKTADRFKHAHARNVAIRACNSDVICNVDADNFTGENFGRWLRERYLDSTGKPMFTAWVKGAPSGDIFGRISFMRKHVIALGGYNEDLNYWGVEDWDIVKRAERAGLQGVQYPKRFEVKPVAHSQESRLDDGAQDSTRNSMRKSSQIQIAKFGTGDNPNAKGRWGKATVEVNWKRTVELPLEGGETLP